MSRVVVVTGGSRGIGAATAVRLARDGFDVCINYRRDALAAKRVVDEIEAQGRRGLAVQADIGDESEIEQLFNRVDETFGGLYGLVNNAALLLPQMRVEQVTAERINKLFNINVTGSFLCAREAVRRMSNQRGGSGGVIVNVSSAASRIGSPGEYVDYAASKGAIDTMTLGLAKEVAEEGIRVNCVRPGFIYTDMHADGGEPDRVERIRHSLPMRRGGQPEEVAAAIAWLISDESSYTTAAFIEVSGGR